MYFPQNFKFDLAKEAAQLTGLVLKVIAVYLIFLEGVQIFIKIRG